MEGWFEVWFSDMESLLETMIRNMVADIEAGYNPAGACIMRQNAEITAFKARFDAQVDQFKTMSDSAVQRWCYYDMKKRGAIS